MQQRPSALLIAGAIAALVLAASMPFVLGPPSTKPEYLQTCPTDSASPPSSVVLLANGTTFAPPFVVPFCINASVTFVGAWIANRPTASAVLLQNQTQYAWPCPGCYATNGSANFTLFPGSYDLNFLAEGPLLRDTVTVTQPIELLYDRVTVVLQPTGSVVVESAQYLSWTFFVPPNTSRVAFYSDTSISAGFTAGLMNSTQWTVFSETGAIDWYSLQWWTAIATTNGGVVGPELADYNVVGAGNFTLVFYDDGSSQNIISFLTPLYLAYNAG